MDRAPRRACRCHGRRHGPINQLLDPGRPRSLPIRKTTRNRIRSSLPPQAGEVIPLAQAKERQSSAFADAVRRQHPPRRIAFVPYSDWVWRRLPLLLRLPVQQSTAFSKVFPSTWGTGSCERVLIPTQRNTDEPIAPGKLHFTFVFFIHSALQICRGPSLEVVDIWLARLPLVRGAHGVTGRLCHMFRV